MSSVYTTHYTLPRTCTDYCHTIGVDVLAVHRLPTAEDMRNYAFPDLEEKYALSITSAQQDATRYCTLVMCLSSLPV